MTFVRSFIVAFLSLAGLMTLTAGSATAQPDTPAPATRSVDAKEAPSRQPVPANRANPVGEARPAAESALPLKPDQVLDHLNQTIGWYQGLQSLGQLQPGAEDLVSRDRLRQQSLTALRLSFTFGQACAAILSTSAAGQGDNDADASGSSGFSGQLDRISGRVNDRVAALQAQLSALDTQIAHARPAGRATLNAQRGNIAAALALAREVQSTVGDMMRFQDSALLGDSKGKGTLASQIADLRKSLPEVAQGSRPGASLQAGAPASATGNQAASGSATSAASAAAASAANFRPDSAGVVTLATQWVSLHSARRQINGALRQTSTLLDQVESLRSAVAGAVRSIVRGAFSSSISGDVSQLMAQKSALEAGAVRFKQLSSVLIPIGEQGLTLETARDTLQQWSNSIAVRASMVSRYLALRIALLFASIAVVLVISEVWRRATFRYLHDQRRRRQFLILRRVAIGIALTLVIIFGLVSELGSVATYAGFVTAGIAVALQNVILAVFAYFFLIGRYGVRVGDRITMAGVTGRVVDIGLVRIYLMELAGTELHSTGRLVVLSNAVLFQPTAMFKQIPGADYLWHTITLTIAAGSDVAEARRRLKEAADGVYEKYRPSIDRQYAQVQRMVDFEATAPQPEVRVRWSEGGLECSVRYPVEPDNSASVDQQMQGALREALAKEPALPLLAAQPAEVTGSSPKR